MVTSVESTQMVTQSCWLSCRYGILLFERGNPQFSLAGEPREGRKDMLVLQPLLTQFCGAVRAFGRWEQKG